MNSQHRLQTSQRTRRQKGVVIVTMALGAFMLCGFAGLALDVTYLQMLKRKAQTAADAAAAAAAIELKQTHNSSTAISAGLADAGINGFHNGVDATVTVENPPQTGSHRGDSKYAQVFVRRAAPTYFMRVFGRNAVTVAAQSVSGLAQMDACVFVLNPTVNNSMQLGGGPQVNMDCGIQVNSNSPSALQVSGGSVVNTYSYNVVGGTQITSGAIISPWPVTGMPAEDDPLKWRLMPSVPSSCDQVNYKVTSGGKNQNMLYLDPGTYCGGIDISTSRKVTFRPGLYILAGGGLKFNSDSDVTGLDVTFFNTSTSNRGHGTISFTAQGLVNLRAPRSGDREAMLIFEDRRTFDNTPNTIAGQANSTFEGVIYMPNSKLNFSGGSNTNARYTSIVVDTLSLTGQSRFNADYSVLANGAPLTRGVLVQ